MATDNPFFSVLIPSYNRAHLILKTLNSVFNQTFTDYEIIVVDNCSTDNTKEVLATLIESGKIRFIQHEKNFERARSRNTAMENARGRFATFLDSDDLMYPENLYDAYHYALKHPEKNIFQNLYQLVDQNSVPIYQYNFFPVLNHLRQIAKGNFFSCIGNFISREIYQAYRFDTTEELQGIEDWEFWMRIFADYAPGRIDKVNSGIVHHPNRSINQYAIESFILKKDYIVNKFTNDAHLYKRYGPYLKDFSASCHLLAASQANSAGLFSEAKKHLRSARNIHPLIIFTFRFIRIWQKAHFKLSHKRGI